MNMYQRDEGIALVAKRLRDARKSLPPCEQTTHLEMLIDACAWTDAVIALMEQELPGWTPRRLIFEDGAWHCSLSRTPFLPLDFDDTADGSGSCPALAMLRACRGSASASAIAGGAQGRGRSVHANHLREFRMSPHARAHKAQLKLVTKFGAKGVRRSKRLR